MTPVQKAFLINCLQRIENILSDEIKISLAVNTFTQNNKDHPRYKSSQIVDPSWSDDEKTQITSVVSESIFQITQEMCGHPEHMKELTAAKDMFLKDIVPKITANTQSENRWSSVKQNCIRAREELNSNQYSFFQIAAVGVTALAIAALAFK